MRNVLWFVAALIVFPAAGCGSNRDAERPAAEEVGGSSFLAGVQLAEAADSPKSEPPPNLQAGMPAFLPAAAKGLRYRWEGRPTFTYQFHIEGDFQEFVQIHDGSCTYSPKATRSPRPAPRAADRKPTATAFVFSPYGYLLTCAHVVEEATRLEVALGGKTYVAHVVATDAQRDLAVLKIEARDLPHLALGNSDQVELGQDVRAVGFPLSSILGDSIKATRGTVSGIQMRDREKLFQVDASINPGNSGGPLVNDKGEVVGVINAKLAGDVVSNVGFAVPVNYAKNLVGNKGLAFLTPSPRAPALDGPTLVKKASAAVALVTVTLEPGRTSQEQFSLGYHGHQTSFKKQKRGFSGPPEFPRAGFPGFPRPQEIHMDAWGRVTQASDEEQLPYMLGLQAVLAVEPLSPVTRQNWQVTNNVTITEERDGGFGGGMFGPRFGPRGFGPAGPSGMRPPFGGPGAPGFGQGRGDVSTYDAEEKTTYTLAETHGDLVQIKKSYQLRSHETAGAQPRLSLMGEGDLTFDLKAGAPRSLDFRGTLAASRGVATVRIPITLSYKLVDQPPPSAVPPQADAPKPAEAKPLTKDDLETLLKDLQASDAFKRRHAANRLAQIKLETLSADLTAMKAAVARALESLLDESDAFNRRAGAGALAVWGDRETGPKLIKLIGEGDVFLRRAAIDTLGKLKDERAAEAVAERLADLGDRSTAGQALQALGSAAEKATLPYLKHKEWTVRLEACRVLKTIGTRESLSELEKIAQNRGDGLVARAADEAVQAIKARP